MIETAMWGVTAASIVGTIANIYRKRWCFIIWGITNATWTIYDLYKVAYPQAALMAVYFILAIYGFVKWKEARNDWR